MVCTFHNQGEISSKKKKEKCWSLRGSFHNWSERKFETVTYHASGFPESSKLKSKRLCLVTGHFFLPCWVRSFLCERSTSKRIWISLLGHACTLLKPNRFGHLNTHPPPRLQESRQSGSPPYYDGGSYCRRWAIEHVGYKRWAIILMWHLCIHSMSGMSRRKFPGRQTLPPWLYFNDSDDIWEDNGECQTGK